MIAEIAFGLFRLIFEGLFTLTGEVVLWVLSFGRRKPRWDLYVNERPMKFYLMNDASLYIGIAFWVLTVIVVHRLFFAGSPGHIQTP